MYQLEVLYDSFPRLSNYVERRVKIPACSINLYGPPLSGKTWLAIDYIERLPKKKGLYLDLRDLRIDIIRLTQNLQSFIDSNSIEYVILDHYKNSFPLPKCKQLIVITQKPLNNSALMPINLSTLDFEEFLAFERRHQTLEHSFSQYIRYGSFPFMASLNENFLVTKFHSIVHTVFKTDKEIALFKYISRFQGKPLTVHQVFTLMKKEYKISKDWTYSKIKELEQRGVISWVLKLNHPKSAKKVTFYDFALPASLYFEKSLIGQLQSIASKKLTLYSNEIFYTDKIDFLDIKNKKAVLIVPFADQQSVAAKVASIIDEIDMYEIKKVLILTISNRFEFMFEDKTVEATPFYEWALQD